MKCQFIFLLKKYEVVHFYTETDPHPYQCHTQRTWVLKGSFPITDSNPLSNRTQQNMEVLMAERANLVFHNKVIDGTAMKRLISRLIDHFGMAYTSHILDQVKTLGFQQATATSISLGIDDLLTIPSKRWLVQDAEQQSLILEKHHHYGNVHAVEK